ncbi:MAG: Ig-like domain-containing protein, partial [Clostridia bacterium]|nr:Ig-like domain-containing protein [Clostridia bacterium]
TGSTSISNTNGMDLYNDGSYVKFTPDRTGKISLEVKMRKANSGNAASTLYMSTTSSSSGGEALANTVSSDTEITIKDVAVEAGKTYYLYNSAGRPTSIKSISYSYPENGEVVISTPAPTVNPTTVPTAAPTMMPTAKPTVMPTTAPTAIPTPLPTLNETDKYMHISFDDVYLCLKDITNNSYTSVFENSFFADLKSLHDNYGAVFTLNCFNTYSGDSSYDISNLPDRYKDELAENADWLKFAFHAEDENTKYDTDAADEISASYNKFTSAILKATGTSESIDTVTRLGFFAGNAVNVEAIKNCEYGITGLLTADDTRVSYYFDDALNNYIIANNDYYDTDKDLRLIRSQTRLESVKNTSGTLSGLASYNGNILEVFTHEASYKDNVPNRLKAYVEWAANNGYGFAYAMDIQGELMKITGKTEKENAIDYSLQINTGNDVTVIAAVYDADGTLYSVNTGSVQDNASEISVSVPEDEYKVKFMLWDSLKGMKPVSLAVFDTVIADDTNPDDKEPDDTDTDTTESEIITLNKTTYPLVVGNKSKTDFSDWETRGSSVQLTATVEDDTYSASDITWESADSSIATVTSTGKVRGRTTGITKVYACLPNGEKKSCDITVIDNVTRLTVQAVEFNTDELNLLTGNTATLTPIIYPKDTFNNGVLNTSLTWSSSYEAVATVENGVIAAKKSGTTIIKAVSADIGRTAQCVVTVEDAAVSATVTGDETVTELTVGESTELNASADGSEIVWKSENSFVADVDENGVVTAYSNSRVPRVGADGQTVFENGRTVYDEGTINIIATAKNGGMTKSFPVKVTENARKAFSVALNTDSMSIASGNTAEITAAVLPSDMIDKTVTWSSSDETVATVADSGRTIYGVCKADISAKKAGTATVTAECDGKKAVCEITVTDGEVKVSDIEINNPKPLDIDEVYELTATVNADANNKKLAWVSTDRDIVTVNNEGTLKGYKSGTVKIYAIALDSVTDTALLEEVLDTRTLGDNNEKLNALLSGAVYAQTEITVKDSSPYLRNLHVPVEAITDNSINLLWNRASLIDTGDWKAYEVYCNGEKLDTVETLGYTAKNLDADTEYEFKISAIDSNGTELINEEIKVKTKAQSKVLNVLDYGAKGNGKVMDTFAIQKAIDECPENGTVLLPKGYTFYSGALFLKSNMTFKVDGVLMGSPYGKDYPMVITRWEGWRKLYQTAEEWSNTTSSLPENHHPYASLINVGTYDEGENSYNGPYHTENIVICGEGQINANGFTLGYNEGLNQKTGNGGWPEPMTPAMDQTVRGRAITIHNAKNVYMKDVTVAYAPSWTIHPIYCKDLTFGDMYVVSKGDGLTGAADDICILNGDGIDPDSSVNVNIFNIEFVTG